MKGYTKIPNNYIEWLACQSLEAVDYKILLFVLRKTVGWGKEKDKISLSQFVEGTGASKRAIINSIERLVQGRALVRIKDKGRTNTYRLVQSKTLVLVQSKVSTSAVGGKKLVHTNAHTKETTKETIQKGNRQSLNSYKKREVSTISQALGSRLKQMETEKPARNQPEWMAHAWEVADKLGIDWSDEALIKGKVKGRWLSLFKRNSWGKLQVAYSFMSDYPTPLDSVGKVKMFFWKMSHD